MEDYGEHVQQQQQIKNTLLSKDTRTEEEIMNAERILEEVILNNFLFVNYHLCLSFLIS